MDFGLVDGQAPLVSLLEKDIVLMDQLGQKRQQQSGQSPLIRLHVVEIEVDDRQIMALS
jgi:hypothetical protein